jgi:hypothetical protein
MHPSNKGQAGESFGESFGNNILDSGKFPDTIRA